MNIRRSVVAIAFLLAMGLTSASAAEYLTVSDANGNKTSFVKRETNSDIQFGKHHSYGRWPDRRVSADRVSFVHLHQWQWDNSYRPGRDSCGQQCRFLFCQRHSRRRTWGRQPCGCLQSRRADSRLCKGICRRLVRYSARCGRRLCRKDICKVVQIH